MVLMGRFSMQVATNHPIFIHFRDVASGAIRAVADPPMLVHCREVRDVDSSLPWPWQPVELD